MDELHNVEINSLTLANNDLLVYNSTTSTWQNKSITSTGIVKSDPSGVTGADQVTNIMSLTQAEYDAITTPDAQTLYIIV